MINIFILTFISALLSFIFTPFVKKFAVKINAIDVPKDKRRVHKKPVPLLGGLGIYFSFIITILIKQIILKDKIYQSTYSEIGIVIAAGIIVLGGFLDDLYDIKPYQKLLFQFAASICLIFFNIKISVITNPFGVKGYTDVVWWLGIPFTIIWVVGITNALNLIDGLDGLADGISLISCITISIIAVLNGRMEAAALSAILSGAALGFLPYNFNPASIFMGDTGAQLLGFLLAAISIEGAIKSAAAFAIAVPILALGLPIYDTLFAVIRRKINGKPIMQADRGHLHHRLLDMGLSQRQAVIIMYLISAVLGGIAIIAMQLSSRNSYFILALVIVVLVIGAWKFGFFKHRE